MESDIVGFADPNEEQEQIEPDTSKKKGGKKSGGFQSMGLSFPVLKGITKRGYKVPTPIQRKTIPLVLDGRDVVAMARTGSGKTACFLVPMFEKLKAPVAKTGARALILSPTRELALQTLKFVKEIGRFTGLRPAVILGGDSMDSQFDALHGNPDIIVATPGRFLHICVEMELRLNSVEYVVFDEADRLFEMGFGEQLREIVHRLPESRQTVLFSATLPKVLVEFAKAGLTDPVLLRLDVESKLPDQLELAFLYCRAEEKVAALICLLKHAIPSRSQTVVFAATKHHVDYLHQLLDAAGISNTFIYSNLDPSARKINAAKFQTRRVSVLVVTDVAARGIDIPSLDFVINYNFPATPKLFVHRVGRCARAGRNGTALSLVAADETPYLLDLHLFLGRPLQMLTTPPQGPCPDGSVGRLPQAMLEEELEIVLSWHKKLTDLGNMRKVCQNAYRQYLRSRPGASNESVKRAKDLDLASLVPHPALAATGDAETKQIELLGQMKKYRPPGTVFEVGQSASSTVYTVMKTARQNHRESILNHAKKLESKKKEKIASPGPVDLPSSNAEDIKNTFCDIVTSKKRKTIMSDEPNRKKQRATVDKEHYIPYTAPDHHTEQGLAVNKFQHEASKMMLDLTADNEATMKIQSKLMRWDRKKKKMVAVNQNARVGKIRTESGAWIPASYKTNRYADWKEKSKISEEQEDNEGSDDNEESSKRTNLKFSMTHWGRHNMKVHTKGKSELQRPEQILKKRIIEEKKKRNMKRGKKKSKKSRR